jgi:hypothetical protein
MSPSFSSPRALLGSGEVPPCRAIDRPSNAEAIRQVLRALDLPEGRIWKRELDELNDVLTADYRIARALPAPETAKHLARILNTTVDPGRFAWNKWRSARNFRVSMHDFDSREISVHAAPYRRGAGLRLWGFSCDMRAGAGGSFIIFLNTAHLAGAVTSTMAHELGHYIHLSIASESRAAVAALASDFASHLTDESELFADSLVALSAYGFQTISKVWPQRDTSQGAAKWIHQISQARKLINPEYRIDFANRLVSPRWRVRYLAATIHFFKLRRALLETAGI